MRAFRANRFWMKLALLAAIAFPAVANGASSRSFEWALRFQRPFELGSNCIEADSLGNTYVDELEVLSAPAIVKVLSQPMFLSQPQGQTNYTGASILMSA